MTTESLRTAERQLCSFFCVVRGLVVSLPDQSLCPFSVAITAHSTLHLAFSFQGRVPHHVHSLLSNTNIQLHGVHFKKRAPRAIKEIKKFASMHMGTTDVRLDPELNIHVWKRGIQGVQHRMRLRISRKRNDEEEAKEAMFAFVEPVIVPSTKGLQTVVVEEED